MYVMEGHQRSPGINFGHITGNGMKTTCYRYVCMCYSRRK